MKFVKIFFWNWKVNLETFHFIYIICEISYKFRTMPTKVYPQFLNSVTTCFENIQKFWKYKKIFGSHIIDLIHGVMLSGWAIIYLIRSHVRCKSHDGVMRTALAPLFGVLRLIQNSIIYILSPSTGLEKYACNGYSHIFEGVPVCIQFIP